MRISYDGYTIDEQSVDIQTYIPKGSVNLSSVSYDSAVFTGVIDDFAELSQCPGNTSDSKMQAGIYYSTDPNVEPSEAKKAQGTLNDDGTFTVALDNLLPDTRYYYGLVIVHNGGLFGEIQEFTTTDLSVFSATDLSSSGSANCYIVSEVGLYKFKPVKGNSSESVGAVSSAEVLWESFGRTYVTPNIGDLVKSVSYSEGQITFQTADTFKEGNAVIAAKDASGNILWSWHIWFTDQPQEQVYYNGAGTMMDRNLGATSATPGDVGALGLLYQWGRKDPFLGSSSIHYESMAEAKSTITWPSAVSSDSSNGTIEYATANPTTFIKYNSSNNDWYYTGSSSTDNTRWTTSDKPKSIYDPCPSGWRVPDGGSNGIWSTALGSSSSFNDESLYSSTNKGMNFSGRFGSASTIWYPASGFRNSYDGSLSNVGSHGFYWSASPGSYNAFSLYFHNNGNVNPSYSSSRAYGRSVRCLQESK